MRVRGWKVVAGLVVGAMMFAGCTAASDASPPPTPTSTRGSSPEPSPSPTPSEPTVAKPERPAEMDRTDEVGAAAAAEYFLSLYAYVMQTGDFAEWDAMTAETCGFCSGIRERASEVQASGDRYVGGAIASSETHVFPIDDLLQAYPVDVTFTQQPDSRVRPDGTVAFATGGDSGVLGVDVQHVGGTWRVLTVTAQEP